MRNRNGSFMFVLLIISLPTFSSTSLEKEITPQEINAKECKKFVDSLFDDLLPDFPASKYLTRKDGALNCTNEMNNNYKNGLPSYATHTPRDVENYREEKRKISAMELRAKNKDTLERIAKSCAAPILNIYNGMYTERTKGASKEDQVRYLRTKLHAIESKIILDRILMNLSYKALDEIYSRTGPTTDAEVANRIVVFHKKCREMYEETLFLR